MIQMAQGGQGIGDDVVSGKTGEGGNKSHTAGIPFLRWVVEPLSLRNE